MYWRPNRRFPDSYTASFILQATTMLGGAPNVEGVSPLMDGRLQYPEGNLSYPSPSLPRSGV